MDFQANMIEHAEFLETLDKSDFDLYYPEKCIGGWLQARMEPNAKRDAYGAMYETDFGETIEKYFGLDHRQMSELCYINGMFSWKYNNNHVTLLADGRDAYQSTPKEAAEALRNMAMHGTCKWETIGATEQ